jgi:DNA-binding beta-propeller fold protein YncE
MTTPAAAPTISAVADKATYNVGDTLTLTVTYADAQSGSVPLAITVAGTDAAGNNVTATAQVLVATAGAPGPMTISATDSFGDTYAVSSNDGTSTAVLTTVVGTPPAAPAPAA